MLHDGLVDFFDHPVIVMDFIYMTLLESTFQEQAIQKYFLIEELSQRSPGSDIIWIMNGIYMHAKDRNFTPSCSWDDEGDCQKNVVC